MYPKTVADTLPFPTGIFTFLVYPLLGAKNALASDCGTLTLGNSPDTITLSVGGNSQSATVTYTSNGANLGWVQSPPAITVGSLSYTFQSILIAQLPLPNSRILIWGKVDVNVANGTGASFAAIAQTASVNTPPPGIPQTFNVFKKSAPSISLGTISLQVPSAPTFTPASGGPAVAVSIDWFTGVISWTIGSGSSGQTFTGLFRIDKDLGSIYPTTINWQFEGTVPPSPTGLTDTWGADGGAGPLP